MDNDLLQDTGGERGSKPTRLIKLSLLAILILGVALSLVGLFRPRTHFESPAAPAVEPTRARRTREQSPALPSADLKSQPVPAVSAPVIPRPMRLTRKVLLDKPWDSAPDALGRTLPPGGEGTMVGPTAVACVGEAIYVLDRSNQRVAVYDATGRMISTIALPGKAFGDLVVDPADSSLLMVDQLKEAVYQISGSGISQMAPVSLREISLGLPFGYDEASGTLYLHSYELDGDIPLLVKGRPLAPNERTLQTLAPVRGDYEAADNHNILLKFKDGREMRLGFAVPVQCVEEMTLDRQGIVWVLFTLQGDYQLRRLARVDPARQTAGFAVLEGVCFAYDVARHMAPHGNGIVIVAGDKDTGRLLAFEYAESL